MKPCVGWREWVALPELGIHRIKAKIDTGARTSALHAFALTRVEQDGVPWVEFSIHPRQRNTSEVVHCRWPVADQRIVRDSGGHEEERFVIETLLCIGDEHRKIEITLTGRDNMGFRMLLGRTGLQGYIVDPVRSYVLGKRKLSSESL